MHHRPLSCPPTPGPAPSTSNSTTGHHSLSAAAQREQRLFIAWRAGESRAGTLLLECLRSKLLRHFRDLPADLAEDLTQEALIACLRARDSLRDVRALRSYVYTVARRMRHRERCRPGPTITALDDDTMPCGLECRLNTERLDIERLLSTDSIPHTSVVAEYYIGGLRAREIADRRRVPEGTVRSQIRRGLHYLRRSVETAA